MGKLQRQRCHATPGVVGLYAEAFLGCTTCGRAHSSLEAHAAAVRSVLGHQNDSCPSIVARTVLLEKIICQNYDGLTSLCRTWTVVDEIKNPSIHPEAQGSRVTPPCVAFKDGTTERINLGVQPTGMGMRVQRGLRWTSFTAVS